MLVGITYKYCTSLVGKGLIYREIAPVTTQYFDIHKKNPYCWWENGLIYKGIAQLSSHNIFDMYRKKNVTL